MNQKCNNCSMKSDDLKCYDCFRKVRNKYVPVGAIELKKKFIKDQEYEITEYLSKHLTELQNLNTVERISVYQKKYCEAREQTEDAKNDLSLLISNNQEVLSNNKSKLIKIQSLKEQVEKLKLQQGKISNELIKKQAILFKQRRKKFEQNYHLRVINHSYPDWSINNELEKIEIPFYSKNSINNSNISSSNNNSNNNNNNNNNINNNKNQIKIQDEKQYQNYILFKKKQNFLTQVQQQQLLFSLNQIALFIYSLQTLFKISSRFPLIRQNKEQILIQGDIRIYDDQFRVIFDENIIYIYLNYKLILQRFHIMKTRNPYFFFDFSYFHHTFLNKNMTRIQSNDHGFHDLSCISNHQMNKEIQYQNFLIPRSNSILIDHPSQIDLRYNSNELDSDAQLSNSNHNNNNNIKQLSCSQSSVKHVNIQNEQIQSLNSMPNLGFDSPYQTATNKTLHQFMSNSDQYQNTELSPQIENQQRVKTYRLLFVKSPLIKIEYEGNLKTKEISFNDPYIYSNKVIQGGWELYEEDNY